MNVGGGGGGLNWKRRDSYIRAGWPVPLLLTTMNVENYGFSNILYIYITMLSLFLYVFFCMLYMCLHCALHIWRIIKYLSIVISQAHDAHYICKFKPFEQTLSLDTLIIRRKKTICQFEGMKLDHRKFLDLNEKTCLQGFRPCKTQSNLLSYRV